MNFGVCDFSPFAATDRRLRRWRLWFLALMIATHSYPWVNTKILFPTLLRQRSVPVEEFAYGRDEKSEERGQRARSECSWQSCRCPEEACARRSRPRTPSWSPPQGRSPCRHRRPTDSARPCKQNQHHLLRYRHIEKRRGGGLPELRCGCVAWRGARCAAGAERPSKRNAAPARVRPGPSRARPKSDQSHRVSFSRRDATQVETTPCDILPSHSNTSNQRTYKERVANLAQVADWLTGSWSEIGPVEVYIWEKLPSVPSELHRYVLFWFICEVIACYFEILCHLSYCI